MSDQELWASMCDGDKTALKTIYDTHATYLFNYGKKIFKNSTIVEDALHDLFVELWQSKDRLGSTDNIRWYLCASLRRRIVKDLKKQQRTQLQEDTDTIPFDVDISIEDAIIQEESDSEKSRKLKAAFAALSPREKEIIYLRFYQGMEYEQIADIVGVKYQSLRNIISKGIKKLRAEIAMICMLWVEITKLL